MYNAFIAVAVLASGAFASPVNGSYPAPTPNPPSPRPGPCAAQLDPREDVTCIANVNGNDLEVKALGPKDGPIILVVPSTFGHGYWYMYKGLEPLFSKYRFIFYDARGSGPFSSKPDNPIENMSTNAMAEDIEGIRALFGMEKVNIFSHCQGAMSALIFAEKYAEKAENLYLAETILPDGVAPDDLMAFQGKVTMELSQQNPSVNYNDSLALLPVITNPDSPRFPRDDEEAWDAIKTTSKLYFWNYAAHQLFAEQMEAPDAPPFSQFALEWNTRADIANMPVVASRLDQIKAHVFLMHGETDGAAPQPYFDLMAETLQLADSELVPKAGHIIWDDAPTVFYTTFSRWFDELAARG